MQPGADLRRQLHDQARDHDAHHAHELDQDIEGPVSYTHLTLPTIYSV